jgi:hypothetical protein
MVFAMNLNEAYDVILVLSDTGEAAVAVTMRLNEMRKSNVISIAAADITAKMNKSFRIEIAHEARQRIHLLAEHE